MSFGTSESVVLTLNGPLRILEITAETCRVCEESMTGPHKFGIVRETLQTCDLICPNCGETKTVFTSEVKRVAPPAPPAPPPTVQPVAQPIETVAAPPAATPKKAVRKKTATNKTTTKKATKKAAKKTNPRSGTKVRTSPPKAPTRRTAKKKP